VTLDPVTITRQKNLAKVGANSANADAQILAGVENENAKTLIAGLDDIARGTPLDLLKGGAAVSGVIQGRSSQLKEVQRGLYKKAQELNGGDIQLDKGLFIKMARDNLDKTQRGTFLPAEIRKMIKEIDKGVKVDGEIEFRPFSVSTIDELETILATAMKSPDGNVRIAVGAIKQAILDAQPVKGLSGETMAAYRAARDFSRKMFAWQKKIPAIKAIVDGVEPDNFMKTYIIGGTDKASAGNVKILMNQIRGDKEATAIVRNQVAAWIKDKAQSGNADELVRLSAKGLSNALKSIGDAKLNIIFNKAEVAQLKAIQRVASYEAARPIGSAVNESNTAATAGGMLLDFVTKLGKTIPGVETVIAGVGNWKQGTAAAAALRPELGLGIKKPGPPVTLPLLYGASTGIESTVKER